MKKLERDIRIQNRLTTYVVLPFILLVFYFFVRFFSWGNFPFLQNVSNIFSFIIIIFTGIFLFLYSRYILSLNLRSLSENKKSGDSYFKRKRNFLLILSLGFIARGVIDGYYAFSSLSPFSVSDFYNKGVYDIGWYQSRFLMGSFYLLGFSLRMKNPSKKKDFSIFQIFIYIFLAFNILLFLSLITHGWLHSLLSSINPSILQFLIPFAAFFLFFSIITGLVLLGDWKKGSFFHWLIIGNIILCFSDFFFFPNALEVKNLHFPLEAFLAKNLAHILFLLGLFKEFIGFFKNQHKAHEKLKKQLKNIEWLKNEKEKQNLAVLNIIEDLDQEKKKLAQEVILRRSVEEELRKLNRELEERVEKRTLELKATNESFKKAEEKFRLLVETSPAALLVVSRGGKIVLANKQTEELFGYSREELIGQLVEVLIPRNMKKEHMIYREHFFLNPAHRPMGANRDLWGVRKDGSEVALEIGLTPLETNEGLFVISSIIDITERKRIREKLVRQREELARSNRELEQFAYVASHDLQSPLRHVSFYLQLLSKKLNFEDDEETQKWIQFILGGAKRMQDLIHGLLAFSRIGRFELDLKICDINELIENLVKMIRENNQNINLQVNLCLFPQMVIYPVQFQQLMQNLLENAVKFRKKDQPLILTLSYQDLGDYHQLSVSDNGIGINPRYHEKIFQIFQRLHRDSEYPGTGIGLSLCKKIVELHEGQIWVNSQDGGGTTFFFTLKKDLRTLFQGQEGEFKEAKKTR